MKKLLALILVAAMVMCLFAACGDNSASSTPTSGGKVENVNNEDIVSGENINNDYVKDQIVMATDTYTSISPWGTQADLPALYEAYEMLYGVAHDGTVYPWLADANYEGNFRPGCDHEPGTGVYTVHIYDYIYDAKGNHITAEDVAWCFMYQYENAATSGWGDLVSVEALDETTVQFTFTEEQSGLGELDNIFSRQFIVSKNAWLTSASNLTNEMCGTGPYMMPAGGYVSGVSITLVKNDNYWQKDHPELIRQESQANVGTIVYQFIDEAAQRIMALQTGTVDMAYNMSYTNVKDFLPGGASAGKVGVYSMQSNFLHYFWANCNEASLCNDINLRLALYYAIDLDGLVALRNSYDSASTCFGTAFYNDYRSDWDSWTNYNTYRGGAVEGIGDSREEIVKYYMDLAGYNGEPLTMLAASFDQSTADILTNILTNAGFNIDLQVRDLSTVQSMEADPTQWDIEIGQMAGDPYNVLMWQHAYSFSCTASGDHSMNFVTDPAFDAQINLVCTEEGHNAAEMDKWMQMVYEGAYGMGLFTETTYIVYPTDMVNLTFGDKNFVLPGACSFADPNA